MLASPERIREALAKASDHEAAIIAAALEVELAESDPLLWEQLVVRREGEADLGEHHKDAWRWLWACFRPQPNTPEPPTAFLGIWNRDGAKSSTAERLVVAAGCLGVKSIAYVTGGQDSADEHLGSVEDHLSNAQVATLYPEMHNRAVSRYGYSEGWRGNKLVTASDCTIYAIGLDKAFRGLKSKKDVRPQLIIIDDVDSENDKVKVANKKFNTLVSKVLPIGAAGCKVLAVQNLIHRHSVFSKLLASENVMADRFVSGPIPAVKGLVVGADVDGTAVITGGKATWEGFPLTEAESMMRLIGTRAFRREHQHEVKEVEGALLRAEPIDKHRKDPNFLRSRRIVQVAVGVDPAEKSTETANAAGIVVKVKDSEGHVE